jgi:beta-mannosidase
LLLSPHEEKGNLDFYIVSDRTRPTAAQLRVSLLDFEGRALWTKQENVTIAALNSKSYLRVPIDGLLAGKDTKQVFLYSELVVADKVVSSNEHFFQSFKNLSLPQSLIKSQVVKTAGGLRITLSSDKLARAVYLSAPDHQGFFVDNYFDLIPGRKAEVVYRTKSAVKLPDFQRGLKIRSLVDAF